METDRILCLNAVLIQGFYCTKCSLRLHHIIMKIRTPVMNTILFLYRSQHTVLNKEYCRCAYKSSVMSFANLYKFNENSTERGLSTTTQQGWQ